MLRQLCLLLCLLVAVWAHAQDEVHFQSEDKGVVTLRVLAYGKKAKEAIANAERAAFEAVLFRGLPGSGKLEDPLAGVDEAGLRTKHGDYFRTLLDEERYRSFILSTTAVTPFAKNVTKKKCITIEIKINLRALRSDLETQGVIRKFGF